MKSYWAVQMPGGRSLAEQSGRGTTHAVSKAQSGGTMLRFRRRESFGRNAVQPRSNHFNRNVNL